VGAGGDVRVVGHQHDRHTPLGVEALEHAHDFGTGAGVEVAGRLVGQQQCRPPDQCSCDRDPLLLATGELDRMVVEPMPESDRLQGRHREPSALSPAKAAVDQRQCHVVDRVGAGEQLERLEHEADPLVAQPCELAVVHAGHVAPGDPQGAAARSVQASQQVHEGGLAGARRAHDGDELARVDPHTDTPQGLDRDPVQGIDAGHVDGFHGGRGEGVRQCRVGRRPGGRRPGERRVAH
jgi:hypothetical protein